MTLVDPRNNEHRVNALEIGSIIGHTDEQSARLWVRNSKPGIWTLIWSTLPLRGDLKTLNQQSINDYLISQDIPSNQQLSHNFTDDNDLTHTFQLTGLKANTVYYYALMSDNRSLQQRTVLGYQKQLYFQTMSTEMLPFSFGFYSCHDPFNGKDAFGAWPAFQERLDRANARFVIGGGDQVYVDCQESKWFPDVWEWLTDNKDELVKTYRRDDGEIDKNKIFNYLLDLYRWYYKVYWNFPYLQMVYERFPQYMIWDDHEIMDGWGSRTKQERLDHISRIFKRDDTTIDTLLIELMWRAARTAYFEFAHCHNPNTPINLENSIDCQWDYSFSQSDIPFFVVDMRGHHDCQRSKCSLLGEAQFERFKQWLSNNKTTASQVLFVVLPVPIVHWKSSVINVGTAIREADKDDGKDEWEHCSNHAERDDLLDAVFAALEEGGKTLVFLSGDVHAAALFRLSHKQYRRAKVFQVTSSAISRMPAGKFAKTLLAGSGMMNENVHQEHLYSHTDGKNFAILQIKKDQTVVVDLHWLWGTENESVIKSIALI